MHKKGFDQRLAKAFNFSFDFNETAFNKFLSKAGLDLDSIPEQVLYDLGCGRLMDNLFVINYAGVLFFAREPTRFVKQSFIECFRYQGNTRSVIVDNKKLEGGLTSLVEQGEAFVKKHTRLAYKFDGFKRINIEEYPYKAIREAIVNAISHRDYLSQNNVSIHVFDDRVEIISPGEIPNGLSLKDIEGKSNPRNFAIVELFKRMGYVERAGSGLKRMREEMIMHGLSKPRFEANKVFFTVTFFGPKDKILDLVQPSNEVDLRDLGLNERQVKALQLMYNQKTKLTNKKYRELFKVSKPTATRDLAELAKTGMIKAVGGTRSLYYETQAP